MRLWAMKKQTQNKPNQTRTARQFYFAVREDLLRDARAVSVKVMNGNFIAQLLRPQLRT